MRIGVGSVGQAAINRPRSASISGPIRFSWAKVWAANSGGFAVTSLRALPLREIGKGFESPWGYLPIDVSPIAENTGEFNDSLCFPCFSSACLIVAPVRSCPPECAVFAEHGQPEASTRISLILRVGIA